MSNISNNIVSKSELHYVACLKQFNNFDIYILGFPATAVTHFTLAKKAKLPKEKLEESHRMFRKYLVLVSNEPRHQSHPNSQFTFCAVRYPYIQQTGPLTRHILMQCDSRE